MVYAVLILAVFAGAFTQGVAGFGSGMVTMALIPLVMDLPDAVAVVAVICLFVNYSILVQLREHVTRERAGPMIAGALIGVPIGLLALKRFDPSVLKITLGVLLIGYAAQSLMRPRDAHRGIPNGWGFVAGIAGGALGGAFNTGGPPSVIYVTMQNWGKDGTKATLTAFFCSISTLQMPLYIAGDVLTTEHVPYIAAALPTLGLGLGAGTRVYDTIDQEVFRRVVLAMLAVMGVAYLLRELL